MKVRAAGVFVPPIHLTLWTRTHEAQHRCELSCPLINTLKAIVVANLLYLLSM